MKRRIAAAVASLALLPATSDAQTKAAPAPSAAPSGASRLCETATSRIEDIQKDLAQIHADELGDDSAPRATMRAAQSTAFFSETQVLLAQMTQARCSPYPTTIGWDRYYAQAISCRSATLNFKTGDTLDACRKSAWNVSPPAEIKQPPKVDLSGVK